MCGIAGIVNFDNQPVAALSIKKMTKIMEHRGPDGEGYWIENNLGLGHRRLAILDLDKLSDQPMISSDGRYILSYNGEIYNFENLKIELISKGYKFLTKSDTEVVLNAFAEWGIKCINKFNGMFAFSIYDRRNKKIYLCRDRYGIKPLYYRLEDKKLVFASEIKSILTQSKNDQKVCIEALNEYFTFQNIFTDKTLFKNIKLLPAAHYMIFDTTRKDNFKISSYWDYNFVEDNSINYQEAASETKRLFEQAVNRQLIGEVEVGSFLSGGIDSGGITALASKNINNLKTFTCGFDLSSASGLELCFDERGKAEFLSNQFKTEHYEVVLKAGDMERVMSDLIWHIEDPRVGQSYPNYYISRLASKFVKVALSGTGGDELFAGYPWRYYRAVVNDATEDYIKKYYHYWQRLISDKKKELFFRSEYHDSIKTHNTYDVFKSIMKINGKTISTPEEYVNRSLYFESKTFMSGLLNIEDKLSMAHSLETRIPFLDNDLVDFAMKIPIKYKLRNLNEIVRINENEPGPKTQKYFEKTNDGKILLRKVLSNYVPENYANGNKQGFSAPDASWFKGESIDYIQDLLLSKNAKIYEYLNPKLIHQHLNEHFDGKENRRLFIWSLLCFEHWLIKFA